MSVKYANVATGEIHEYERDLKEYNLMSRKKVEGFEKRRGAWNNPFY